MPKKDVISLTNFLNSLTKIREDFDKEKISYAYEIASMAHEKMMRKSGDPYINHLCVVSLNLAEWGLDDTSIIAGLLHDSLEKRVLSYGDIVKEFGQDVARIVKGVTKISSINVKTQRSDSVENMRRMFLAMSKDLRVVFVRLAEKKHNLETLSSIPKKAQIKSAREALEILAPLAERLGMGKVKAELEDLAFSYLYAKEHTKVQAQSEIEYEKAAEHIKEIETTLAKKLKDEGLQAEINGRKKGYYSLWKKLERLDWDFAKIHDIVALRIIVEKERDCYHSLGIVHELYPQAPFKFSDFISLPKPNGYRSIHTKVFGPQQRIVEIQIRTKDMHQYAEHGAAAHWVYSEVKSKGASDEKLEKEGGPKIKSNKLEWVKQLVKWQEEITNPQEFEKAVKFDALSERIFVFSPKGDVFDLPRGSTPVDFAYAVHTDLGQFIKSAKVNGNMVPLDYKLKNTDIVEIQKTKIPRDPNRDWLDFVKSTAAVRKIKQHFGKNN